MLAPEITLDAALRDVSSEHAHYRHQAIRNLATALLAELGKPGPRFQATTEHQDGEAVRKALLETLADHEPAPLRGLAAMGLGYLGEPALLDHTEVWLEIIGDDDDRVYLRECAVLAASFLGKAAADADAEPELQRRISDRIEHALTSDAPDLRFQAGVALIELRGADAEPALVEALRVETVLEVREGLVGALAYLDPPGPDACDLFETILRGEEGKERLGFQAAMTLAAARRPALARPRLLVALDVRHERDDALEALAALGPAERLDVERVHRLARRVLLPSITRVRAAYALARMAADGEGRNPGVLMLERLRWHPRAAVREAVRDAFANLERLAVLDRDGNDQ